MADSTWPEDGSGGGCVCAQSQGRKRSQLDLMGQEADWADQCCKN
jgi:hypothetical protein